MRLAGRGARASQSRTAEGPRASGSGGSASRGGWCRRRRSIRAPGSSRSSSGAPACLEVHAVDAGDRGRHRQDGRPGRELAGDHRLLCLARHQARLEREGETSRSTRSPPGRCGHGRSRRGNAAASPGRSPRARHVRDGGRPRRGGRWLAEAEKVAPKLVEALDLRRLRVVGDDPVLHAPPPPSWTNSRTGL